MRSPWIERRIAAPVVKAGETYPGVFYAAGFLLSMEMASVFEETRTMMHAALHLTRIASHHAILRVSAAAAAALVAATAAAYAWRRSGRGGPKAATP
jgi:hypothetical protein